jgi:hypothetical protein
MGREAAFLSGPAERRDRALDVGLQSRQRLAPVAHGHPDHARPLKIGEAAPALDTDLEGRMGRARGLQRGFHFRQAAGRRVAQKLQGQVDILRSHPPDVARGYLPFILALHAAQCRPHRGVELDGDERA